MERLITGPIRSIADLAGAESAIQVLLFYDYVDILVPAYKWTNPYLTGYSQEDNPRGRLDGPSFELFRPLDPYDRAHVVEELFVNESGKVTGSNFPECGVIGMPLEEVKRSYMDHTERQAAVISAVPIQFGLPAYFHDPRLEAFLAHRGFIGRFYRHVSEQWWDTTAVVPQVDRTVIFPPLLSIVLDRAPDRERIPETIHDLREELAPVRSELKGLTNVVTGARRQRDIEERARETENSFRAIIAASRRPVTSIVLPLLKLYRRVRSPLDGVIKLLSPDYQPEDPRLMANRTITGRMFSKFLNTDSMHSLATYFFSESELRSLSQSGVASDRSGALDDADGGNVA